MIRSAAAEHVSHPCSPKAKELSRSTAYSEEPSPRLECSDRVRAEGCARADPPQLLNAVTVRAAHGPSGTTPRLASAVVTHYSVGSNSVLSGPRADLVVLFR